MSLRVMILWRLKQERRAASNPTLCSKYLLTPLDSWTRLTAAWLICGIKFYVQSFSTNVVLVICGPIKHTCCCRTVYMDAACPLVLAMEFLDDAHRLLLRPGAFMMDRGVWNQQSLKRNYNLRYL